MFSGISRSKIGKNGQGLNDLNGQPEARGFEASARNPSVSSKIEV